MQQPESPAADPGTVRLDNRQSGRDRDRGIEGVTSFLQNIKTRIRGQCMRAGDCR